MSAPKPKWDPDRRGWTQRQVAIRLGLTEPRFCELKQALYEAGLPRPDPLTGRTDGAAVDHWMNVRSGLIDRFSESSADSDVALKRVLERRHGAGHA